jgi:hypothetical protein
MKQAPSIIYDFDPRNLPAEFLRAVGLVAVASSQTESIVQNLIGGLLGIDAVETKVLTLHMAAPLKDHVARALIELNAVNVHTIDEVDKLLDAISSAAERRNAIVHNSFCIDPRTGAIFSLRAAARGSLQMTLTPVTTQQIEEDATLIYEVGLNLQRFMAAFDIMPRKRTLPIRTPVNRKKKAREERVSMRSRTTPKS